MSRLLRKELWSKRKRKHDIQHESPREQGPLDQRLSRTRDMRKSLNISQRGADFSLGDLDVCPSEPDELHANIVAKFSALHIDFPDQPLPPFSPRDTQAPFSPFRRATCSYSEQSTAAECGESEDRKMTSARAILQQIMEGTGPTLANENELTLALHLYCTFSTCVVDVVDRLVGANADPFSYGDVSCLRDPAFYLCVRLGADAVVDYLLTECRHEEFDVNQPSLVSGETPLALAIQCGHVAIVELLLDYGASANVQTESVENIGWHTNTGGRSFDKTPESDMVRRFSAPHDLDLQHPLHVAVASMCVVQSAVCTLLLRHRADFEATDLSGERPLHLAAKLGRPEVCELLLRWSACPTSLNAYGASPLLLAAQAGHRSTVCILVQSSAALNMPDALGMTPLMHACASSCADCVLPLLQAECSVHDCDPQDRTALVIACEQGNNYVVRMLIGAQDTGSNAALRTACAAGHVAVVQELLSAKAAVGDLDDDGNTLLHTACGEGRLEVVRLLLATDAMCESICTCLNARRQTAVDVALLREDHEAYVMAVLLVHAYPSLLRSVHVGVTKLLQVCTALDSIGAAVLRRILSERGNWGQPELDLALSNAAQYQNVDCVRHLLHHQANVRGASEADARDPLLHRCASDGQCKILRLLLAHSDAVDLVLLQDRDGMTPLMCAARNGHIACVMVLLLYGSGVDTTDNFGRTALYHAASVGRSKICELLVREYGAGVGYTLSDGSHRSILHAASQCGSLSICSLLLAHLANPNARTSTNASPLLDATAGGHDRTCQLLLDANADCAADNNQVTPLMEAAFGGHKETVQVLLRHGVLPCGAALDAAVYNGHVEVCEILVAHNADVRWTDEFGWTPAFTATMQGNVPALDILAKGPVDWHHVDAYGLSATQIACATNTLILEKLDSLADACDDAWRATPVSAMHRRRRGLVKKFEHFLQRRVSAALGGPFPT